MATYLGTGAVFEVRSGATSGNKGGAGFNPANAHFPTDGVIAGGTGNTATITPTSSYSPVAGDSTCWVFFPVQSGVTYASWFPATAAGSGVITMNTAVGAGVQIVNNKYVPNAVAGCASTATPTLTYGIDYSQQNSAQFTSTTATTVIAGTTFTGGANTVGNNWIGNFIAISSTSGTAGWYEITNQTSGTATLDRSAGASAGNVTYYLGGAASLGGSTTGITDVIFFALGSNATTAGCRFFFKGPATYTPAQAITTLVGSNQWPSIYEGYTTTRGDRPTIASANQPKIACGANSFTNGNYGAFFNLYFTGTNSTSLIAPATNSLYQDCKIINSGTTTGHTVDGGGTGTSCYYLGCEVVSYTGKGINRSSTSCFAYGCYIHDSTIGVNGGLGTTIVNCIIAGCITENINAGDGATAIWGNTIYGAENKLGIGINNLFQANILMNNIIYGFVSGTGGGGSGAAFIQDYNCFYNNTTNNNTGGVLGPNDLTTVSPSFSNVAQVTGTTATSSSTTLTDSGKNFTTSSVVAGRDYLYVKSGTGATVGIYGIVTVGTTTLTTDNSIGTSNAGNLVYQITTGRNFAVGSALKNTSYPRAFPAGLSTGYGVIGAVGSQYLNQNARIFGGF